MSFNSPLGRDASRGVKSNLEGPGVWFVGREPALHALNPGVIPTPHKPGSAAHPCNLSTQEVGTKGSIVQGHLQLQSKFMPSLVDLN